MFKTVAGKELRRVGDTVIRIEDNLVTYDFGSECSAVGDPQGGILPARSPAEVPPVQIPVDTEVDDPFRYPDDAQQIALIGLVDDQQLLLHRVGFISDRLLDDWIAFREALKEVRSDGRQGKLTPITITERRIERVARFEVDAAGTKHGQVDITRPETDNRSAPVGVTINCVAELVVDVGQINARGCNGGPGQAANGVGDLDIIVDPMQAGSAMPLFRQTSRRTLQWRTRRQITAPRLL